MKKTRLLSERDAAKAGEILKNGGTVAIPTETVYGLAASAFDAAAVLAVFEAKGRPADNPLIVHIAAAEDMGRVCADIPEEAHALGARFWPGPLSLVLKKRGEIPPEVSGGLETVAVRVPGSALAREIISAAGVPIAAPSANTSGKPSPTRAAHVLSDMDGRIDAVVDGGECAVGVESTVLDLTVRPFRLLRPGGVSREEIEAAVGPITVDRAVSSALGEGERPAAPGMKYRHYAPEAPAVAVCGAGAASAAYIAKRAREEDGVICFDEFAGEFSCKTVAFGGEGDHAAQARGLYSALRAMDSAGVSAIFIQCPEETGVGFAVANRIKKAAGFNVVDGCGRPVRKGGAKC